jgi:hypothetical protein
MLAAIASVPYQLNDSHTVFIPLEIAGHLEEVFPFCGEPVHRDDFVTQLQPRFDCKPILFELVNKDVRCKRLCLRAVVIGDNSSGRVNLAQIFWEKVGAFDMVAFGTEIAVAKVVMEDGQELENRGVKPDQFCIPTAQDLHQEKDPCLDQALKLARTAATLQK